MSEPQQQETQTQQAASAAAASGQAPPPEEVAKAVEAAKAAKRFQDVADALKKEAALVTDPVQREKLWTAAYLKEKEAHGESKKARIMASGWGQGAGIGVGISSAVGMGLGNVVGALLSGVVAIPGVLVGSGVGAIHGPWYRLKDLAGGGKNAKDDDARDVDDNSGKADSASGETSDVSDEEAHKVIVEAARKLEEEEELRSGAGGQPKDEK
jgi:hypothetical protein